METELMSRNAEQLRQEWVRELQIGLMARDWEVIELLIIRIQNCRFEEEQK
jgi:hypothetical protein